MFQSFTGSARRPRQVNLGGRTTNPFAAFPSGSQTTHRSGPQNTLAIAQQERIHRQQERERFAATERIQRAWRGHRSRKSSRDAWRAEWDMIERERGGSLPSFENLGEYSDAVLSPPAPYRTAAECLAQLRLLVHFLETWNRADIARLVYFSSAFQHTLNETRTIATDGEWTTPLYRLARLTLRILRSATTPKFPGFSVTHLLQLLVFLTDLVPKQAAQLAQEYYSVMAILTKNIGFLSQVHLSKDHIIESVLALLRPLTSETLTAYEWFAKNYLTIPDLSAYLGSLDHLANNVNYKLLILAMSPLNAQPTDTPLGLEDVDSRLWFLSYFIYFHRYALGNQANYQAPELEFVKIVSDLLNSTAVHVSRQLEMEDLPDIDSTISPLHPFVKRQVFSLINQTSITGLLSQLQYSQLAQGPLSDSDSEASGEAKIIASYALTLLRVFPRRGDDIRMWIYLGSASSADQGTDQPGSRVPAIKYFWYASRSSKVFRTISQDSTKVLRLLKPGNDIKDPRLSELSQQEREEEWTIILLFLELYTFVLKVMDDEEFFSSGSSFPVSSTARVSWTKESALPLSDIKDMTVFLKNLAFTLYWNSADLNESETSQDTGGIRNYFSSLAPPADTITSVRDMEMRHKDKGLPGVTGIPIDYFKGLVTGLLRMIHEREYVLIDLKLMIDAD